MVGFNIPLRYIFKPSYPRNSLNTKRCAQGVKKSCFTTNEQCQPKILFQMKSVDKCKGGFLNSANNFFHGGEFFGTQTIEFKHFCAQTNNMRVARIFFRFGEENAKK